jgi:Domain of unknown function (DUF4259)
VGAWGPRSFENDDALDWVEELETRRGNAVREALTAVAEADYADGPAASVALAAAEVVAAGAGRATEGLPDFVQAWVAAHGPPPDELVELARRAVRRVATASELRELWDETGETEWHEAVRDLRVRVGDLVAP